MKKNIALLYGFSFFDQFMIVIALWVPYLATQGIGMRQFNERISSAFRATVISMANLGIRASFCLLGPLVGYGIDGWGLPSVLSALGLLFSIAFVVLLLPLVVRGRSLSPAEGVKP